MNLPLAPAFALKPRDPRLANFLHAYPSALFNDGLYQSIELMERYSIDLAIDLLARLEIFELLDQWHSAAALARAREFQSHFCFPLSWLLERLVETNCVVARSENGDRVYRRANDFWQPELAQLRELCLQIDPANAPTLDLLDYAASLYPAVARGEQSGEQALFGPPGIPLWLNYFHNENQTYAVNNWIGAIVAADHLAAKEKFRVLEVGAGAGSASGILLHSLQEHGLLSRLEHFLITEPNAFFRRRGQREVSARFPDLPLEWNALDLNLPWAEQGVAAQSFDLIYGVNVLHVAKDLLFSLNAAHDALKPGGFLVIGECIRPRPLQPIYAELIFQILDSFTEVKTDPAFRPNPGFLTPEQWRAAFARANFEKIEVVPEIERIRDIYSHFFTGAICGQRASSP